MANTKDKTKEIIEYYDQTAFDYKLAWYKKDNPALHFGFYTPGESDSHYEALNQTNIELAKYGKVQDGHKILDAGCGIGGSSLWLAANFDIEVTGITLPAGQVEHCKENAQKFKLKGKVNFLQADYCQTPFDDQSFDLVWACESVCHTQSKIDFYKEAFRVLKPGGRLVMAEYLRSERPLSKEDEILLKEKWLKNWAIDDIDTKDEHQHNLDQSGFEQTNIQNINSKVNVSLRNLHEKCTRSYPMERVLNFFRIRSNVQHGNLVGSISQYEAFEKGIWWYAIITAQKPH